MQTELLVIGAVLAAAFLRGLTGFGFALAAVPILSLAVPPVEAVAIAVLLQLAVGLRDVVALRGSYDRGAVLRLGAGALLGTPFGVALLAALDVGAARVMIAAVVLVSLLLLLRQPGARRAPPAALTVGVGALSGLFSGLAAMPGPPAVAYFLAIGAAPATARASLMMFFFLAALMAAPGLAVSGAIGWHGLLLAASALPALMLGSWAGAQLFRRMRSGQYRAMALAVLAVSAVLTGLRGLVG